MTKDGWYEGLQLFTPSTNNSLKATNRAIKDEDTLSDRLVLSSFTVVALSIQNTTIKLSDWTNGYNWAKLNKQVIEKETDNEIMYYLPAKDVIKISDKEIHRYDNAKFNSFDTFKNV
ncbi:hypothetical protein BpHYR1_047651 [Brachionus plicatilis]|uniref:Uncharacterized protein n=1 Tax=Brachionus plicatilis TaxID=10195 RepID=A0A3M7RYB1_BRAPC|nr:hypothetical protein BpHYR1_047651 [Brachionus plicatilis]